MKAIQIEAFGNPAEVVRVVDAPDPLEEEIRAEYNFQEIVGKSLALKRALHLVETVA